MAEPKIVDPEAELSCAQSIFLQMAPECSVAKRSLGIPQLAPQEKQLNILTEEMKETMLCIKLGQKGQHAIRDSQTRKGTKSSVKEYEQLELELRDERLQQAELDCLNDLAGKQLVLLRNKVPIESEEIAHVQHANLRLRQMENRLELATKRFCDITNENARIRKEIDRLLVERNSFNVQWNRMIDKLVKGKEYLMDIFEIATHMFNDRDDCCTKLETLKWKGLFQLNKDIAEMQSYEGELNHLAKLEEFLRVKGSRRICEADEIEELQRLDEIQRCEQEIANYDALLQQIFAYADSTRVSSVINRFKINEIDNFSIFQLLTDVMTWSNKIRRDLDQIRQKIVDQREINESRAEREESVLQNLREELEVSRNASQQIRDMNLNADNLTAKILKGINDLVILSKCVCTPLLRLLGNHKEVTRWNVDKFLKILEMEVKSLVQVGYGAVKPPAPTPKGKEKAKTAAAKLVADPVVLQLRPNRIENLVPYQPCPYCVEDYMMNLVFETPAVPADREYVEQIFHLEEINTKFGIYTLTIPAKRHPYRKKD